MDFLQPNPIIEQLLSEFLADHEAQLGPEGHRRYAYILDLLELFLQRHPSGRRRREFGTTAHPDRTSGGLPGAAELIRSRSKFLADFLPHEMAVDAATVQLARTVIQKLGDWLSAKGHVPRG